MIILKGKYKVLKIIKSTNAIFYKDIIEGDILEISHKMEKTISSGKQYVVELEVVNLRTNSKKGDTLNFFLNRLENFLLEEE